jgi:hypothetical protein
MLSVAARTADLLCGFSKMRSRSALQSQQKGRCVRVASSNEPSDDVVPDVPRMGPSTNGEATDSNHRLGHRVPCRDSLHNVPI